MVEILSQQNPTARKDYYCDAWVFLEQYGSLRQIINELNITFAEKRVIIKTWKDGRKIRKGTKYTKQNNKMSGDVYTFRAIPEIHEVCIKNEMYYDH